MSIDPVVLAEQLRKIADALTTIANEIDMHANNRPIIEQQNHSEKAKGILSVTEMAEYLNISRATAYQMTHIKGFPTLRIGRRILIPTEAMLDWINQNS